MFHKYRTPHPDSPLSPFAWQLVLYISLAYIILCAVIIVVHIISHHYGEIVLMVFSMLFGWIVLNYLWSEKAHNYAGRSLYKNNPGSYWFGVLTVLIMGVMMCFALGSGWFMEVRWAWH